MREYAFSIDESIEMNKYIIKETVIPSKQDHRPAWGPGLTQSRNTNPNEASKKNAYKQKI